MKVKPEKESGRTPDLRVMLSLLVVTLVAFALRVWGIKWGLPDSFHNYSFHPDEVLILGVAIMNVNIPALQLNPHFFNYPSLYIYAVSLALSVASVWGLLAGMQDAYLTARIIVVVMGTASVFFVYLAGRKLYGKWAGVLAASIFAVMPLVVVNSHYGTVDVPAAFWVAACLAAAAFIDGSPGYRPYILAGLAAGLATGTKYNAGLVLIVPVAAHFVQMSGTVRQKIIDARLWLSAVAALVAFILSTPGVIFWTSDFWRGFSFELWHSKTGHGLVFVNTGPGWLYTVTHIFAHGLGIPLTILTIAAIIYGIYRIYRRDKANLPLVLFFIVYYAMISLSAVRFSRYAAPLTPAIALMIAGFFAMAAKSSYGRVWKAAAVFVVLYTLVYSVSIDRLFVAPDTRESAMTWIKSNIPAGTSIGLPSAPWFYTPPFVADMGHLRRADRMEAARGSEYKLVMNINDWDPSVMQAKPEYIVISDYEKLDGERSGDPGARAFLRELKANYRQIKSFGDDLRIINPPFIQPEELPHDMKYMHPTIWIWKRQ